MGIYFLQTKTDPDYVMGKLDDKIYIKSELDKRSRLIDSCDAESWIKAKEIFGYPLTDKQRTILETGFDYETMA